MLKTLKGEEEKLLKNANFVNKYIEHFLSNPGTLLPRIYGFFTMRFENFDPVSFYVMNNILGKDFADVVRLYDLKGSTYKREKYLKACEKQSSSGLKVLKDLNFVHSNEKIDIQMEEKNEIIEALRADSLFLQKMNLMDYSLLLAKVKKCDTEMRQMPAMVYNPRRKSCEIRAIDLSDDMGRYFESMVGLKWRKKLTKAYGNEPLDAKPSLNAIMMSAINQFLMRSVLDNG